MHEMIESYVVPKWRRYLQFKSENFGTGLSTEPRVDTLWKKILRDVREFYRILFRVRFHYLDFKDSKGALKWIELMFSELGLNIPEKYRSDIKLFSFIHQSHKLTNDRIFRPTLKDKDLSPFEVIEKFNDKTKRMFMNDNLWAQLFYFVLINYLDEYCMNINIRYQPKTLMLVCLLLRWYNKMTEESHLSRIDYLLRFP